MKFLKNLSSPTNGMVASVGGMTTVVDGTTVKYYNTNNPSSIFPGLSDSMLDNGWFPKAAGLVYNLDKRS